MSEATRGLGRVDIDAEVAARVAVGAVLAPDVLGVVGEPPWPVFGPDGELLAYYERHKDGERVKPSVVLTG